LPPEIANITFACEDPDRLARFWAAALEYEVQELPPDFMEHWLALGRDPNGASAIVDPEGRRPRFFFQQKRKTATEVVPLHLDIHFDDPDAAVQRLISLGAECVEAKSDKIGPYESQWVVMRDPEGNGFCVQDARNPEPGLTAT
jgi:catechol 2,3-dioxygenase-like lactoylglutathione lyase family enzyme